MIFIDGEISEDAITNYGGTITNYAQKLMIKNGLTLYAGCVVETVCLLSLATQSN